MSKLNERALLVTGLYFEDPPGIVDGADWALVGYPGDARQWFYRFGGIMQFEVRFQRTGGNLNVPQDGDIPNQLVCTLPAELRGNIARFMPISTTTDGRMAAGGFRPSDGQLYMTAVAGSTNISNGTIFTMGGLVLMDVN